MIEQKKLNINLQVSNYLNEKDSSLLVDIYQELFSQYKKTLTYWNTTTDLASEHDVQTIFDDSFMKSLQSIETRGGDFVKCFHLSLHNGYKSLLRKLRVRRKFEIYEIESEDGTEAATFEIADDFNLEDQIIAKKRADQRRLIDSLLNGSDAKTMAIVEAFLASEKPTPTAIGEALGLHHSTVIRSLKRLAGKFDSKQYGEYTDYLVAL